MRKQKTAHQSAYQQVVPGHPSHQMSTNFLYQPLITARAHSNHNYTLPTGGAGVGRHHGHTSAVYAGGTPDQFAQTMAGIFIT